MNVTKTRSYKQLLFVALTIITISSIPLIFYFSTFAPLSEYSIAKNDQAWANFGSFIGGTIGPILSAFAFYGVWATYGVQREQLEIVRRQGILDEIQRLISSEHQALDIITKKVILVNLPLEDHKEMTIQEILFDFHKLKTKLDTKKTISPANLPYLEGKLNHMKTIISPSEIKGIIQILKHIDDIYQEYLECGGSRNILRLYAKKHILLVDAIISTEQYPPEFPLFLNKYD